MPFPSLEHRTLQLGGVEVKVTGELYGRGSVGIYLGKLRRGGCVGQTLSACESGPGHERRENSAAGRAFEKPGVDVQHLGRGCSRWGPGTCCGLGGTPTSGQADLLRDHSLRDSL